MEPQTQIDEISSYDPMPSEQPSYQPPQKPYLKYKDRIKKNIMLELGITIFALAVTLAMFFVPMYSMGGQPFSSFNDTYWQINALVNGGEESYLGALGFLDVLFILIQVIYCIIFIVKCVNRLNKLEDHVMLTYHGIRKGENKRRFFAARPVKTGTLVYQALLPMIFGVIWYIELIALNSLGIVFSYFQLITGATPYGYVVVGLWFVLLGIQIYKSKHYKAIKTDIVKEEYAEEYNNNNGGNNNNYNDTNTNNNGGNDDNNFTPIV